jgi:squalene-hopene/tetraprenyl-beta-curcumene cyclase
MRRAVAWLVKIQNPDGGWGESGESYRLDYKGYQPSPSAASQTAWALLGLMAAGEADNPAVARGVAYLAATQAEDGFWNEPSHTATGFPRVFYLRYHGYSKFFPLWALARYRNLKRGTSRAAVFGMSSGGNCLSPPRANRTAWLSRSSHIHFNFSSRLWIRADSAD